jgi:hypothetical protein
LLRRVRQRDFGQTFSIMLGSIVGIAMKRRVFITLISNAAL